MLPELLAPAGSFDAAIAAFAYGADAVYLGLSRFSARADAQNFDDEAFAAIVAYAHGLERPRKVYVTLNTLLETRERADLIPSLALLAKVGVDAVIVQDLGLARIIRKHFPTIHLHASTQLACTSTAGARALKALGFERVVTARELTLKEAADIGRAAGVEIEVFVHGALCYSISGLCLFSSLATGRSGNRGRCAYCCRQAFREGGRELGSESVACHPFSMRDLATLDREDLLRSLPLASLKIEGRMKNPLYVAAVTDIYRTLLDGKLTPSLRESKAEDLRTIFSRPWTPLYTESTRVAPEQIIDSLCIGHRGAPIGKVRRVLRDTDGHRWMSFDTARALEKHDGLQIDPPEGGRPIGFAVDRLRDARTRRTAVTLPAGTTVDVSLPPGVGDIPRGATVYCSASQAVRRAFPVNRPRTTELRALTPADLTLTLRADTIELSGSGVTRSTPATLAPAKDPARSEAAAHKLLSRLGEDGFWLRKLTFNNPDGLFLPASLLNATRRAWAEAAREEAVAEEKPLPTEADLEPARTKTGPDAGEPQYTVKVSVLQPVSVLGKKRPDKVVVMLHAQSTFEETQPWRDAVHRGMIRFALPPALRDADLGPMAALVGELSDKGYRCFECADLTSWQLLQDVQPACDAFDITADWTWYAVNPEAVALQRDMGLTGAVTGPEANLPNLLSLPEEPAREVLICQYAPFFMAFTKPLTDAGTLLDRNGFPLRITRIGKLWSTFGERPWSALDHVADLRKNGFRRFRIDLSWAGTALPHPDWVAALHAPDTLPSHFGEPRL